MDTTATGISGAPVAPSPRSAHDGLLVRARALLLRHRLDELISRAVDRHGDRALARRTAELAGGRVRRRLADRIEELLELATRRRPGRSAAVPIDRKATRSVASSTMRISIGSSSLPIRALATA